MAKENESTTKFKVDISNLKKGMQEAARQVRLANAEFKEATAGMDNWGKSADGLEAKMQQLDGVLSGQKKQLELLEKQYNLTVKELGANSKEAQELAIKMANQSAAVKKTESDIKKYRTELAKMASGAKEAKTDLEKLEDTIETQEKALNQAKNEYKEVALAQGENAKEAKKLAERIKALSTDLQQNREKIKEVEGAADNLDKTLKDTGDSAKDSEEGFTIMKGALADLLADGIRKAAGALKEFAVESESAYNKFQAQTGVSAEEMKNFRNEMDNMYNNAFGDNLKEIGDKMAYVKQVTGEVDPSKVRELAENAMTLEETFGSDFQETIRGVKNLMEHFGIDAKEAFDLYAKGSQEGLDYTNELGDNIAEYAGNFQQAGYSAQEYFQLLDNGTEAGAYNLDKVNDSINEVKNRLADGSIEKNLAIYSDSTQELFKKWQNGEASMKDVINSIVGDINNCQNEQEALTMAATAFGTMGEDANLKVVKSLTTVGDKFEKVEGTMNDVKKIRYDDVGTQWKELGRTMEQELLQPLAKKALPQVKELANTAIKNIDKIIPMLKTTGKVAAAIFVTNKAAAFAGSIKTLVTTITAAKTAITAADVAAKGLNATWLASPFGVVTVAVTALTGALTYLAIEEEKEKEAVIALSEEEEKNIEAIEKRAEAYKELDEARDKETEGVIAEYGHLEQLKEELNSLIDTNGQVKEGYEDRANFIVNQLSEALGIEEEKIWGIIQKNGELGDSIDKLIEKKKAEAILNANEELYTEAIKGKAEALKEYEKQLGTYEKAKEKMDEYNAVCEERNRLQEIDVSLAREYAIKNADILRDGEEIIKTYKEQSKALKSAEDTYVGFNSQIQNYEGLSAAIISGDSEKIQIAMANMQYSFITAETGTKESLERQVKNLEQNYKDMKTAIANNTPGVTQEMVDQAKQMADQAKAELDKLPPEAEASSKAAGDSYAAGLASKTPVVQLAGQDISNKLMEQLGSPDTRTLGSNKGADLATGMSDQMGNVAATGRALGNAGAAAAGEADYYTVGQNSVQGLADGLAAAIQTVKTTASNIASSIIGTLRNDLDIHSPSREAFKIGDFFTVGLTNALAAGAKKVIKPAKEIAKNMLDTTNDELTRGIEVPDMTGIKTSVRQAGTGAGTQGAGTGTENTAKVVKNYFYQTNNSPKALSQLDIYRQTKNLLGIRGGNKTCLS